MGKNKGNKSSTSSITPYHTPVRALSSYEGKGPGAGTLALGGGAMLVTGYVMWQVLQVLLALLLPIGFAALVGGGAYAYHKYVR